MAKRMTVHNPQKQAIYDIMIEHDFERLQQEVEKLGFANRRFCIVTDSQVGAYYSEILKEKLQAIALHVCVFKFEAGEARKNLDTVRQLYTMLIEEKFDRKDVLFALGGGVVGDLTGFTAATYLRGIAFIQVPTSLLAFVDSSIGGKTGVDFDCYKNMVGAFYQPKLVYMNLKTLDTLDLRQFYSGLAEVLKHGIIKDLDFYVWMLEHMAEIYTHEPEIMEEMVERSCSVKREVVEKDPTEQGERALLNFGHTIGHSIEKLKNFQLLHGECVALGIVAAAYISWKRKMIEKEEFLELRDMMVAFRLPISVEDITPEQVVETTKSDKKMDAGTIRFILLKDVGHAYIDTTVTDDEMKEAAAYLMMELEN